MNKLYPAFLKLQGKRAVVAGGGPVALRKARSLLDAGAAVTVISPELCPELLELALDGTVDFRQRKYRKGDLRGASIAVAATDDPEVNRRVADDAGSLNIPVNCAAPPEAGDFIVPSSIHRPGLTVAITTGGGCPALSRRIRREIEASLGGKYSRFLSFLEEIRAELKERVPDARTRGRILDELVNSGAMELFKKGGAAPRKAAKKVFLDVCERTQRRR